MITVSLPANAFTFGRTVIVTVSYEGFGQPDVLSVAANIYEVVLSGVAIGFNEFGLLNVDGDDHVKEVPFVCAFSCVDAL